MTASLDQIDRVIIRQLQSDGRTSYTELGRQAGLSVPATRQRVQRLMQEGVLQVAAVTDPLALGYPVMALLGVRTSAAASEVAEQLAELDSVVYLVSTAGSYDLFVEVVCETMADLAKLIDDGFRSVSGVRHVESFPYFGIHVHRFTWGVPESQ